MPAAAPKSKTEKALAKTAEAQHGDGLVPLAPIVFDRPVVLADEIGTDGDLIYVDIDHLFIDPAYQRPVLESGRASIRRMLENFHWALFAPLVVAKRGEDRYAIIDGQHRAIAAKSRGDIEWLPCWQIVGDAATEARAFAVINGAVTKVHSLHIFRARLAAGDGKAKALAKVCRSAGVTVCAYPKTNCAVGETLAIATLENCLAKFGPDILTLALKLVVETGDGNAGLLGQGVIAGLCDVLRRQPRQLAQSKIRSTVDRIGIRSLHNQAAKRQAQNGGTIRGRFADLLAAALSL